MTKDTGFLFLKKFFIWVNDIVSFQKKCNEIEKYVNDSWCDGLREVTLCSRKHDGPQWQTAGRLGSSPGSPLV